MPLFRLLLVFLLVLSVAEPVAANRLCGQYEKDWAQIEKAKDVTPKDLANAYLSLYGKKNFDREAQAVLTRMTSEGIGLEPALAAHLERYHADKSAEERAEIERTVRSQLGLSAEVLELILFYEGVEVTLDMAEARLLKSIKRRSLDPEPHLQFLRDRAASYGKTGLRPSAAMVKAYTEAWNTYEVRTGVLGVDLLPVGGKCFIDAAYKIDGAFRSDALKAQPFGKGKDRSRRWNRLDEVTAKNFGNAYIMVRGAVFAAAQE